MTSRSSLEEVSTTTGIAQVRGSLLMRLRTSWPSSRGSFKSSRMSFGLAGIFWPASDAVPNRNSRASTPSRATCTVFARLAVLKACSVSLTSLGLSSTSRISARGSTMIWNLRCEVERRAPTDGCFNPDTPAVALDNALDDRQAHASAFEILRAMQSLEYAEQLVGILHVEASAIVADKEDLFVGDFARTDLYDGVGAHACIFESIVDEVHEYLLEQCRITPDLRQVTDAYIDATGLRLVADLEQDR